MGGAAAVRAIHNPVIISARHKLANLANDWISQAVLAPHPWLCLLGSVAAAQLRYQVARSAGRCGVCAAARSMGELVSSRCRHASCSVLDSRLLNVGSVRGERLPLWGAGHAGRQLLRDLLRLQESTCSHYISASAGFT